MNPGPLLHLALLFAATALPAVTTRYVDLSNPAPSSPYTDWTTAATNIQDAIVAADIGDLVLVTNGLYQTGGMLDPRDFITNRVAVTKPLTVQSVNGPSVTTILGSHGDYRLGIPNVRCAYATNGASLIGFTLTNGSPGNGSPSFGGGVFGESRPFIISTAVLSNCVLSGNSAYSGGGAFAVVLNNCTLSRNSAGVGGAAYGCMLNNCTIVSNTASGSQPTLPPPGTGGGTYRCTLTNCLIIGNSASAAGGAVTGGSCNNCTIVSNTAPKGGGVDASMVVNLTNCILFYNSATTGPNYQSGPGFSHCCTTPLPAGSGNFTNDPALADPAAGDFRLQTNSPCINGGINFVVSSATDLDGNPRIAGGTIDIGAYELQAPASTISYVWLQQYGLPTDGSADSLDTDSDGMANWQEWRAGTNPTNAPSALHISSISAKGAIATLRWQSASGITYALERSTNLMVQPAFIPVQTNIAGTGGQITISDTNSTPSAPAFYRLSVQ